MESPSAGMPRPSRGAYVRLGATTCPAIARQAKDRTCPPQNGLLPSSPRLCAYEYERAMDDNLLERLKAGDPEAQRACRERYLPWLARTCGRWLGDRHRAWEVAEDVLADVMIDHVAKIRQERSLPAYLHMVATRRCGRLLRVPATTELPDDRADPAENAEVLLVTAAEERLRRARIGHCMEQLRPRVQTILRMRFHGDHTQEAIGRVLGVSKQYVGRVLARSLEDLKRCLEASHE